jgi:hypothetical protein
LLALKCDRPPHFLEVKSSKGKPSTDQLDFGRDVIAHGASWSCVRSIDDVQALGL